MKRLGKETLAGVGNGIAVSLAYATVEFALLTLVPLARQPATNVGPPFWHAMELLLVGYVACGALLGAAVGGIFGLMGLVEITSGRRLLVATLLLPIVFAWNLLAHGPLSGSGKISIAMSIVVVGALVASIRATDGRSPVAFLTGPLTISALLLLPPWLNENEVAGRSDLFQLVVIGAVLLVIMLLAHLLRKMLWMGRTSTSYAYPWRVLALLSVTCAAALALNPRSPALPQRASVAPKQQPNVILIVMDTVRADHTSLYGYERDTTPYLRELAKEATLYKRAFAVSDYTLPTHASMFTGLYPRTHGAYFAPPNYPKGRPLAQHFTTMAEILKNNGYRTAGIVANPGYLSPGMGVDQGFEVYDWRAPVVTVPYMETQYLRRQVRSLLDRFVSTSTFEARTRDAGEINREAYKFLDQVHSPFFLFVNYMDAHGPWVVPPLFERRYPCLDPSIARLEGTGVLRQQVLTGKRSLTSEEEDCLASGYDSGIAYMDSQIRELVSSLRSRGLFDNTMIMVTGDHGEAFGQRNELGHGGVSVYQSEVGVPLLIKYPGASLETPVDKNASQVDFLPTVLDVASIRAPDGLQGISLRKLETSPARYIVSMSYRNSGLVSLSRQFDRVEEALLFGDKKLVESTSGKKELFDLSNDVKEQHNLYQEDYSDARELTEMLTEWTDLVPLAPSEGTGATDRNTMERLKSLGYAQ